MSLVHEIVLVFYRPSRCRLARCAFAPGSDAEGASARASRRFVQAHHLQETFTRVARKPKCFDNEEAFWSWLALLARCAAIDAGRRRQRYCVVLRDYATAWFRQDQPEDANPNLHDLLELSLASLERGERELIEAKYFYGATVRDLAHQSGASEKAIESRLLRLRRKLREHMLQSLRDDERSR